MIDAEHGVRDAPIPFATDGAELIDVASAVVESHLLLLPPASPTAVGDMRYDVRRSRACPA